MQYSKRGDDYALFESLVAVSDRDGAPDWRFGKYVDSYRTRETLRQSPDGRAVLMERDQLDATGRSHEKTSDIAPFVAWDGEGITYEQGMPQSYVLFGCSLGHRVISESLTTADCLDTILEAERSQPESIHVGFAFKYDAEMILRDLPLRHWWTLRRHSSVRWAGYQITYHPGRVFRVSVRENNKTTTATIYDVWGFFQGSFVKALRGWLDESELEEIQRIEDGKAHRGNFTTADLHTYIVPYWEAELRLLVLLADRLRERLVSAGFCPSQWHGAGALATTLYRATGTRAHISRTAADLHIKDKDIATILPAEVNDAARHAYAGGRFELFKIGHTKQRVYQYDINSAYPNGISRLPSFKDAEWELVRDPDFDSSAFALWQVSYNDWSPEQMLKPGPLPHRSIDGRVSYPMNVSGWYWTPEAALIANSNNAIITAAWVCHHNGQYPFTWVRELYEERKRRKAAGDPSEKAYKLGLNSLYGKMAQRLGWQEDKPLPRFHQLEWAGWVTSFTRMMLYAAMLQAGSDLIAVETDAVFSLRPLDLDCGPGLGQWEVTEHEWMTYLQSGTYWSDHGAKYRGFDRDSLTHDEAMSWLQSAHWSVPLVGTTSRFVGAGRGLGTPLHRCWITESRDLLPGRSGKRLHLPELCRSCADGISPAVAMHPMFCSSKGGQTFPHHLPWLDDDAPGLEWQEAVEIEGWDYFDE